MENVNVSEWIRCPVCGNKTRDKMRENTVLENFPLFCPKCKRETLISVKQFHMPPCMSDGRRAGRCSDWQKKSGRMKKNHNEIQNQ